MIFTHLFILLFIFVFNNIIIIIIKNIYVNYGYRF